MSHAASASSGYSMFVVPNNIWGASHVSETDVSITKQRLTKESALNMLFEKRDDFIKRRNAIVDNPIKYFIPSFRKKIRVIDLKLKKMLRIFYEKNKDDIRPQKTERISPLQTSFARGIPICVCILRIKGA